MQAPGIPGPPAAWTPPEIGTACGPGRLSRAGG